MKKQIAFLTSFSLAFLSAAPMYASAYSYEYYYSDYYDEYTYSTRKEYKTSVFTDENSRFNGCDLYTVETVEAYEGLPTLETKYDYLVVPDSIIGSWFEHKKDGDKRFAHQYDVKLPLHTGYVPDDTYSELLDSHCYNLYVMWKKIPYISITADTEIESFIDRDKLAEMYPDAKYKYITQNDEGNYVYYISTGDANANFNEYEYEVDSILTYEDAQEIYKLVSEHIISFTYCSSYEMQEALLGEYPVYSEEYVDKAAAVFESHGYSVTIGNSQEIIPDKPIAPLEYFEIIFEIQEEENVMPKITMYENSIQTIVNSTELKSSKTGDVNGDGDVNIADAVNIMAYAANPDLCALSDEQLLAGDVYQQGDGVGINDAASIQKYLTRQIDSLPESTL